MIHTEQGIVFKKDKCDKESNFKQYLFEETEKNQDKIFLSFNKEQILNLYMRQFELVLNT